MDDKRQQYLESCRKLSPLIAFHKAVMKRVPKKYEKQVIALLKAHADAMHTNLIETLTAMLGIIWQCKAAEVGTLLKRMMARSKGQITYRLGENQRALGFDAHQN